MQTKVYCDLLVTNATSKLNFIQLKIVGGILILLL